MSTFTVNLGIEEPATGMYANTWGNVANRSYRVIDAAIGGVGTITLGSGTTTYSLATVPGTDASTALYPMLAWMGTPGATATVTISPNTQQRLFIMSNRTSDGSAITFAQGGGTPFTLQSGHDAHLYCDGNGANAIVAAALNNPQFNNVLVQGVLQIDGSLTGNLNLGAVNAATLGLGSPTSVPDPLTINGVGLGGQIRLVELNTGLTHNYGVILRNDGGNFYVMPTAADDLYGNWDFSTIALTVNLASGAVAANVSLTSPTIVCSGNLSVGGAAYCGAVIANGSIQVDAANVNAGTADLFFGTSGTEGIGSARMGGAGVNQGGLTLYTAGAARLVILNNGQFGINMFPVDSSALTVSGVIRTTGGIVFPDGSVQTTAVSGTLSQLTVQGNVNLNTTGGGTTVNGNLNVIGSYLHNGSPFTSGITGVTVYVGPPVWTEPGIGFNAGSNMSIVASHNSPGNYGTLTFNAATACDARLKRNVRPLEGGLSIINQLRVIEAEFNGLGATREGERTVGVLAQELQRVLPGCVVPVRGKLRITDVEETDVLYVSTYELLFQMLLALQQLSQRMGMSDQELS